jgi:hypothetical protein
MIIPTHPIVIARDWLEQFWQLPSGPKIESDSSQDLEVPMAQVLDRPRQSRNVQATQPQQLRKLKNLITEVAAITSSKPEQIEAAMMDMNLPTFDLGGEILVYSDSATAIVDQWAASIKRRLASGEVGTTVEAPAKAKAPRKAAAANQVVKAKRTTKKAEPGLKLPTGFTKLVTRRYSCLEKMLPQNTDQRAQYLEAIVSETKEGKEFLGKIAKEIASKTNNRPAQPGAYDGLLEYAKSIYTPMPAEAEQEAATV